MSDPVPLSIADLTRPFVYERQYGVIYVPGGYHPSAMSFLLALQLGCEDGIDAAEEQPDPPEDPIRIHCRIGEQERGAKSKAGVNQSNSRTTLIGPGE